jgi:hypothetical protein
VDLHASAWARNSKRASRWRERGCICNGAFQCADDRYPGGGQQRSSRSFPQRTALSIPMKEILRDQASCLSGHRDAHAGYQTSVNSAAREVVSCSSGTKGRFAHPLSTNEMPPARAKVYAEARRPRRKYRSIAYKGLRAGKVMAIPLSHALS